MSEPGEGDLPEGASRRMHRFGRWIGRTFVRLPYRTHVHHLDRVPRTGPLVLVANHSSLIDGPLLFGMLPREAVFLVKHEMFKGPLGWFLRRIGQIPVRRGEPDRTPLLAAVRVLRAGGLVAVFPEGTRSGGGDVANAEHGAAWLARTSGARMLPVACRGTRRPEGRGRRLLPRVDVLFGEPVTLPVAKGRAGLTAATEQVRDELVGLIAELDGLIAGTSESDDARGKQA
ncbi:MULTISPECIES: 1-acyl-sn-glycerol-3-phosphate acyltransferase [Saccharopolyspora]|uniref:lysophospholipid acyltransferase family protein n=1 Tax=Saccharopolyspora TaxID=1835 RepID=UPI001CD47553|nr:MULTISPECIES: lysophospholipid acyltransferase family protein [Saccharopolyspora]MCA1189753.1 1-acyl-sn-glycerol-3-phosphate acyltransferase [Saccharopolyspora sp. 6T]MCA1193436.1 1-acyl-sn-glycerol-3-phosphate acyltransferase [Saccharopolyspora sp. 6V]MCA1226872.1 1-acyl-sn-glycerol-3-phosphate acyltransferase [Saccharopolyspora sp. 6M]